MSSITNHIDGLDKVMEVIMERMVHEGSFLLVEGETDVYRFDPFISSEDCSVVNCESVCNVKGALDLLNERGMSNRVIAVIDADFSRVRGVDLAKANLIVSETHDLDLDWIKTSASERYLNEVADAEKIAKHGGVRAIIDGIHQTLRPISTARLLSVKGIFKFKTSGIDVAHFYSHKEDLCANYAWVPIKARGMEELDTDWIDINSEIKKEMTVSKNDWQMTNGHNMCAALGSMLRSVIGSRKQPYCSAKEIELGIRLAFDIKNFKSLKMFDSIQKWESSNGGYRVLCPSLAS